MLDRLLSLISKESFLFLNILVNTTNTGTFKHNGDALPKNNLLLPPLRLEPRTVKPGI
jgi:hypothetical protein